MRLESLLARQKQSRLSRALKVCQFAQVRRTRTSTPRCISLVQELPQLSGQLERLAQRSRPDEDETREQKPIDADTDSTALCNGLLDRYIGVHRAAHTRMKRFGPATRFTQCSAASGRACRCSERRVRLLAECALASACGRLARRDPATRGARVPPAARTRRRAVHSRCVRLAARLDAADSLLPFAGGALTPLQHILLCSLESHWRPSL